VKSTIEPINSTSSRTTASKNLGGGGAGQDLGACAPWPQRRTATDEDDDVVDDDDDDDISTFLMNFL